MDTQTRTAQGQRPVGQPAARRSPISKTQQAKLDQLMQQLHPDYDPPQIATGLEALFMEAFHQPLAQAEYDQAAQIVAKLIANLRDAGKRQPAQTTPAPAAQRAQPSPGTATNTPTPIPQTLTQATASAPVPLAPALTEEPAPEPTPPEMPYSANFMAKAVSGFEVQFTVRRFTQDNLLDELDALTVRLEGRGYVAIGRSFRSEQKGAVPASVRQAEAANTPEPRRADPGEANWMGDGEEDHICPIHKVAMRRFEREGQVWYSHKMGSDWCKGKLPRSRGRSRSAD